MPDNPSEESLKAKEYYTAKSKKGKKKKVKNMPIILIMNADWNAALHISYWPSEEESMMDI